MQKYIFGNTQVNLFTKSDNKNTEKIAFKVWISGKILSSYISSKFINVENKHVIELGSGMGICGITAAKCGAINVTFTDLNEPEIISDLENNISLNDISNWDFLALDWKNPDFYNINDSYDIIIASDCTYNCQDFSAFTSILSYFCHSENRPIAYVLHEARGCEIDIHNELLLQELEIECVQSQCVKEPEKYICMKIKAKNDIEIQ